MASCRVTVSVTDWVRVMVSGSDSDSEIQSVRDIFLRQSY